MEPSEEESQIIRELTGKRFIYRRVGYDERPMTLADNRQVGEGQARLERLWDVRIRNSCLTLTLASTDKAERLGMQVVLQDEAYTSQECPRCGCRHKPRGRVYLCSVCGFRFHRDGVGSINIRRKYLGLGPVVGAMASPTGVRWHPHRRTRVARDERERIPAL